MFDQRLLQALFGAQQQGAQAPQQQQQQQQQGPPDRRTQLLRGASYTEQLRRLSPAHQPQVPWEQGPQQQQAAPEKSAAAGGIINAMLGMLGGLGGKRVRANDQQEWIRRSMPYIEHRNLAPRRDSALQQNAGKMLDNTGADIGKIAPTLQPVWRGYLRADEKKGEVVTPGGYGIIVKDGVVRIEITKGKWTTLKADPPGRTITRTQSKTETRTKKTLERVLARDPVVKESDGDIWRYQGSGSFILPDGTKITVQEIGKTNDLHINQVDIYNGDKHVCIKNRLVKKGWKTVRTTKKVKPGGWRTQRTRRRTEWRGRRGQQFRFEDQVRNVVTEFTDHQVATQEFQTTFSGVTNDARAHDLALDDGMEFRLAGRGEAWQHKGKEVVSGAGKGKDDKTKAFKLGKEIDAV